MLAHAEAQRDYGAAMESHNEYTRNTLKMTCSHKWWETLKGSIFGVKPFILAFRGPRGGLVLAPLRKPHSWALSLTVSSVVNSLSLLFLVSLCLAAIL